MIRHFSLVSCSILLSFSLRGQATFEKTFDVANSEIGWCVIQTDDGGYLIGGAESIYTLLIKTNAYGDTLWTKYYDVWNSSARSVQQTFDGGYIVCGSAYNGSKYFVHIMKLDVNGDTIWTRGYGADTGALNDDAFRIKQTADSGFVISGTTSNFGGSMGIYLLKTDSSGALQWSRKFSSTSALFDGSDVCQASDGGYVTLGTSTLFSNNYDHIIIVKTDGNGDTLWTRDFEGTGYDNPKAIQSTVDGGFIICGSTSSLGNGDLDGFLLKIDSLGIAEWANAVDIDAYNEGFNSIQVTTANEYVMAGTSDYFNFFNVAWLTKTNDSGNVIWSTFLGAASDYYGMDAIEASNGGYLLLGGSGQGKICFEKTDSAGTSCVSMGMNPTFTSVSFIPTPFPITVTNTATSIRNLPINKGGGVNALTVCNTVGITEVDSEMIEIFPNPANNFIVVKANGSDAERFLISDLLGKIVYESDFLNDSEVIPATDFAEGFYMITVCSNKHSLHRRVQIIH